MQHREVGVGAFLPAGEDAAEAVEPGVGALDDPAACAEAGLALDRFCFLAAAADMRGERKLIGELADLLVVVGGVEAEPLRNLRRRLGPLDRDALECVPGELVVVQVRARWRDPDRDALTLGEERSLRPFLALSVGLGPVFGPPSGALVIAPSAASQAQSIPTTAS